MFFLILSILLLLLVPYYTCPVNESNGESLYLLNCRDSGQLRGSVGRSDLDEGAEYSFLSSYHPRMSEAQENDLIWKTDSRSVEIRFQGRLEDGRPALDEVVATGAAVHLEQMNHDQWWMGIEAGGRYFHLNFSLNDGRLSVHLSDQTDDQGKHYAEWEGDNREKPIPGVDE